MVIPIGSASAERGFSIMNTIRTDLENRMKPPMLAAILRIKVNMPNDVEQFRAVHYARKWISENHKRSDDPG